MKKQSAAILLLTTVCLAVGLPAMAIPSAGTGSSATWTGAAGDGLWADANNWSGYKVPSQLNGAIFNAPATVTISKGDNTDWLQINSSGVQLVGANLSTASINIAGTE